MNKIHVLLVFGGQSSEHEVSIKSAHNVFAALDNAKYDVSLCYISKKGHWFLLEDIDDDYAGKPELTPRLGKRLFMIGDSGATLRPDILLPVLHGKFGEDGSVQGLAKMLHLSCVGPSLLGAAVTMDKDMTKRLLKERGIPVVPELVWYTDDTPPTYLQAIERLGKKVFVKPCNAGSSVGVSMVGEETEWEPALKSAAAQDTKVIIERAVDAREIELAVLGNTHPSVTCAGEILPGEVFYTYEDKYAASSTSSVQIPADITEDQEKKLQRYARDAYHATGGTGMARVDFFIDRHTGDIYLNEINSIPGFTNISMYPKLWHHEGKTYTELIDELISLALK